MNTRSQQQNINYVAIELLERLGNRNPSQAQIDLMESLITKVAIEQRLSFDHKLTAREITCLLLAAKGRTSDETAAVLGIKTSTVETYRKKIKRKLACTTMAQAVFEGIRYGYVSPEIE